MSNFALQVSKIGNNVLTAEPKDLAFDSRFDTLKVAHSGKLTMSLPNEVINFSFSEYSQEYSHGFSYVPFYLPLGKEMQYLGNLETGGDYVVNDLLEVDIPAASYSPSSIAELHRVYVTDNILKWECLRINFFMMDIIFGARDVELYYTLFYNRIDEEVDYLN
jgi:hypothetical protein